MKERMMSFAAESFLTQEKLIFRGVRKNSLLIGVPCEDNPFEKRTPLTPESVALLVQEGHQVIMESGVGDNINYTDMAYSEAGATIVDDQSKVWQCDIVMKIGAPSSVQIMMMRSKACVISMMNLDMFSRETLAKMAEKRVTAIAFELISDSNDNFPIINTIKEIEGKTAVLVAADMLSNKDGGKGILIGGCVGVSPTEIVVIGAGKAGCEAAKLASAMGALVRVFDNNIDSLRELQGRVFQPVFTSTLHPNVLKNALRSADVVIGASKVKNGFNHYVVTEDLIESMKKGSILIDIAIAEGGCFETSVCPNSEVDTIFQKCGVTHYCTRYISNHMARTSSIALSNHLTPVLFQIAREGSVTNAIRFSKCLRSGAYIYNGKVVNMQFATHLGVGWRDIMLFIANFQ